jgi:GxxExxY protein
MPLIGGHEDLTERIIACAMEVHSMLGPGLLESIYTQCLAAEFRMNGLSFSQEQAVPVVYKGQCLGPRLVVDFVVEHVCVVEIKAVAAILPVHVAQGVTYVKLTGCPVGLLINFNVPSLRSGIKHLYHPDLRKRPNP